MKKLWFLFFLVISCSAVGQPAVKIYAYSRVTTPGTVPVIPDESGKPSGVKIKTGENYYIYAVYAGSAKISFAEVWIGGKYFQTQTERIESTPVLSINNDNPSNPVKEILVPATTKNVISISPVGTPGDKTVKASWFRKMAKNTELIVSYFYKGKKYFIGVKKIKPLLPVAGV